MSFRKKKRSERPMFEKEPEFSVQCNDVNACSRAPKPEVLIPGELWDQMVTLCRRIDSEWFGYLTGAETERGVRIETVYFPPQSAAGAHVHPITELVQVQPGTVGAIHSHVAMAARFSSLDTDHANWPVEIVVNRAGDFEATVRFRLPCGSMMRANGNILLTQPDEAEDSLLTQVKEAIEVGERHEAARRIVIPPVTLDPDRALGFVEVGEGGAVVVKKTHWPEEGWLGSWHTKSKACSVRACYRPVMKDGWGLCAIHYQEIASDER